jgi:hypothetical protein
MSTDETSGKLRWLQLGAVAALAVLLYTHFNPREVRVPSQLVGTWTTSDPQYANRSLEIGQESITFGTGPGTESTGFVEDVRFSAVDGKTLYTISYSSPDGPGRLSFYFGDDGGRTIRLRNQEQIVWKKSD